MTPSLEGWPIKAKEAHSPLEVRLAPLDTNPVFKSLGGCTTTGRCTTTESGNSCEEETHIPDAQ